MIQELMIKDFAIILELHLSFFGGMTVLTGETGAGKSIIIDAVGLLVGGRGSSDFIRDGAEKATIEGQFLVNEKIADELKRTLEEFGIELEEDSLIISRAIHRSGKNVCRINNHLVNIQVLKKIGHYLVDIHGQHEHQELMNPDIHINYLDQFGNKTILPLKKKYQQTFENYQRVTKQLVKLQNNEQQFVQRMDMLKFQKEEIESATIQIGEESKLMEERQVLVNHQKITDALNNSYGLIQGEEYSSLAQIARAMGELESIKELNTNYREFFEEVSSSYYQLEEATRAIQTELSSMELDEERLNFVEERLNIIRQLKRKYGESEEQILTHYKNVVNELEESFSSGNQQEKLEKELEKYSTHLASEANALTVERQKIAKILAKEIVKQLKDLYLDKTVFEVRVAKSDYAVTGQDQVEFYISTNPGESPKPLVKIASGGELSRVMLGMKSIFSEVQGITSIVFDEVDTGVSGRVAQAIANKIHHIAEGSQVLCITHLPQVAAAADHQLFIEKEIIDDRTETKVRLLSEAQRIDEVARMLAGEVITDLSKQHALELLELSR